MRCNILLAVYVIINLSVYLSFFSDGKDPKLEELKQFQTTFKLSDSQESKDKKPMSNRRTQGPGQTADQSSTSHQPQPQEWQVGHELTSLK